jgi:catechol 2,3-dioxygenase
VADLPTRIRSVELRCSDVERSAEFYARLSGLEVAELGPDRGALRRPGSEQNLLVLDRAQRPGRAPRNAAGLFHTAFRFPDRPALAAALLRLSDDLSQPLTGASDHGVSEALYLDDPDGLGIELYRDRPQPQWPHAGPGERVHMFTAPLDLADLASEAETGEGRAPDIGHVHLKVSDVGESEAFWIDVAGLDLMTRFGSDASFLGLDGYHHHIGINSWSSRGAGPEPSTGPGLQALIVETGAGTTATTPDGVVVELRGGG